MSGSVYDTPRYKWAWFWERRVDLPGWLEDAWQWLGCKLFGHVPISDQCNIPDHDYCAWCRLSMPGQGGRSA